MSNESPDYWRGFAAGVTSVTTSLGGGNSAKQEDAKKPRKSGWAKMSAENKDKMRAIFAAGRAKRAANLAAKNAAKPATAPA